MEGFLSLLKSRRSVRRYESTPLAGETLDQLLESIQWSPSWANSQCWEVVVVTDPQGKARLQATMERNPAKEAFSQAPAVLVLCARLERSGYKKGEVTTVLGDWFMYDLGIATQSLCLTAHSLGLGTVVVGLFDHGEVGRILGVPDDVQVVSMIPVGIPLAVGPAPVRRGVADFTHRETF